ncbi:hypothetical protein GOY13_01470 [Wolbachia endosymbiont of Cruorifilaria tuberocauda]|uniref:hypothetical protein n=1 Tax=Wolbachia endosymbiont of Cruorifilaria tuberocauda TaxID=1812111 RepID=UPI001589326A|nr:hypothetical protein [Wolbachia endosymbiont of Cruorifilaria tuberocauda]QKX01615.1 hypothetical protein GOY13_01470 [Wolbachia endosymbiont of Cruorifilaria tuberocauda]
MKKYIFLLAMILVLISSILYLFNNINSTKQSIAAGNKFYKVFFSKKETKLLEETDSNWKYLADFENAFNHISNSAPTDAAFIYNSMVNNKGVPSILSELAQYLEIMNLFHSSEQINENKINNLASSIVYPYSSQEAIALIKINNNDIEGAVKILHLLLNDKKCPTLIRANAQELLSIYEIKDFYTKKEEDT